MVNRDCWGLCSRWAILSVQKGKTHLVYRKCMSRPSLFALVCSILGLCESGNLSKEAQNTMHTPMFIAVLFTIAMIWKQPKCPSVHK